MLLKLNDIHKLNRRRILWIAHKRSS